MDINVLDIVLSLILVVLFIKGLISGFWRGVFSFLALIISFYAATMEASQMRKYRDSIFIRPFPQRLDSRWRPASGAPTIENTYEQLL